MNIRKDHVVLPTGAELAEYHVLEMPDWVCVVCTTRLADGAQGIVLVQQYRHAAGREMLELPAGAIEDGESAIEAAVRELREETGYVAESTSVLPPLYADPSRITNLGHTVLARHLGMPPREPRLDAGEDIEVVVVPASTLPDLIRGGELAHATHVAAILLAARNGHVDLEHHRPGGCESGTQ